jgi:hypothetical protein
MLTAFLLEIVAAFIGSAVFTTLLVFLLVLLLFKATERFFSTGG